MTAKASVSYSACESCRGSVDASFNTLPGAIADAKWRAARRISNLSIKLRSVLGCRLRTAPAPLGPLINQPVLSSTWRICCRVTSSSESVEGGSGVAPASMVLPDSSICAYKKQIRVTRSSKRIDPFHDSMAHTLSLRP